MVQRFCAALVIICLALAGAGCASESQKAQSARNPDASPNRKHSSPPRHSVGAWRGDHDTKKEKGIKKEGFKKQNAPRQSPLPPRSRNGANRRTRARQHPIGFDDGCVVIANIEAQRLSAP